MSVEVHPLPFRFPNFLRIEEWPESEHMLDVGFLSVSQASAYWDELRQAWIDHCSRRSALITDDLRHKASQANRSVEQGKVK